MKRQLRSLTESVLRRVPLARAAYYQRDALQARLDALEAAERRLPALPGPVHDPRLLEEQVPIIRSVEERILIATRCRDADVLPKVERTGEVVREADGTSVQIMFNGVRVAAAGYNGAWMQDLIERCRGHHEPQEELLFAEVLRHLPPDAAMIELGGFWSFYSIWFLREGVARRSIVLEPIPSNLDVGRTNARLNGVAPIFVNAFAAASPAPPQPFQTENSAVHIIPGESVASLMETHGIGHLHLLHCDAQGIEFAIIESCLDLAATGRLEWLVVSTHSHHISGDPLTHQRCLAALRGASATILAEHDVQESFSGDGLIVAKFGPVPAAWISPRLSFNRYSESLFRNPLYDLAQARAETAAK